MVEEGSLTKKCSCWTKEEMVIFKVEKAVTKKGREAKKLAKQMIMVELGFAKKPPKTPKGERE